MKQAFGFTDACNECWVVDIACSRKHCWQICFLGLFNNNFDHNACIQCDEDMCGGAFKKCSGANRRRLGLIGDIPRPGDEVCWVVDRS